MPLLIVPGAAIAPHHVVEVVAHGTPTLVKWRTTDGYQLAAGAVAALEAHHAGYAAQMVGHAGAGLAAVPAAVTPAHGHVPVLFVDAARVQAEVFAILNANSIRP